MNRNSGNYILGIIIILLGLIFLFNFDLGDFLGKVWPLILIAFGLYLMVSHRKKTAIGAESLAGSGYESGIPGIAGDIKVSGLKDGVGIVDKSLLFGDIVINLADSKLLEGENTINSSVLFGDITIVIPEGFPLKVDLAACIGDLNFKDKRVDGFFPNIKHTDENYDNAQARLFIKGRLCFGDIKVIVS